MVTPSAPCSPVRRRNRRIASAGTVLAFFISLAGTVAPAAAQRKDDKAQAAPSDVTVTLKLVQVYVTGKDGKPVSDLGAPDFTVTDNGKPVAITHFEKHIVGGDETAAPATAASASAAVKPLSRKFFLFFDLAFVDARGMVKSRAAALDFIDNQLQPGDEVGVLSFSGSRGFTVHEYLTPDRDRIRKIVDGFGLGSYAGRAESLTRLIYADEIRSMGENETAPDFYTEQARQQAAGTVDAGRKLVYVDQARRFLEVMANLALALRTIPGYKNIILFSGGIARGLLFGRRNSADAPVWTSGNVEEAAKAMSAYDEAQSDTTIGSNYSDMLKEFKAANAPVYAIDVSRSTADSDPESATGSSITARDLGGAESLRNLAGQTGGKYYSNTTDVKAAVADIQSVTSVFYVLGYSVPATWDGKYHKLKVKVGRKGVDIAAQNGYFNPTPFRGLGRFQKLLHMTDLALSDSPQLDVPVEPPLQAFPLRAGGWDNLAVFLPLSGEQAVEVLGREAEAFLLLFDEKDKSTIKTFRVKRTAEEAANLGLTAVPAFILPVQPGVYTCRIVVRNSATGHGARGTAVVKVPGPAAAAAGLRLQTPLFLRKAASSDLAPSPELTLSRIFAYDPAAYAPTAGIYPTGTEQIYAALRLSGAGAGDVELTASLRPAGGGERRSAPVSLLNKAQSDSDRVCLAKIEVGALPVGTFDLDIVAKPSGAAPGSAVSAKLIIRD